MSLIHKVLAIISISQLLSCTSLPSDLEMEKRAGYGSPPAEAQPAIPSRKKQRVEEIYVGSRMLPWGDWFKEGRVLIVVDEPGWIFDDPKLRAN